MKNFGLQFFALLLLFTGAFFLASWIMPMAVNGDSVDDGAGHTRFSVQVVLKAKAAPPDFWRIVEQGIDVASEEFQVSCEVTGPTIESDIDGQINLVRAAIAKKPDAIILAACDYERLVGVCLEAERAGIPVVVVDSDVAYESRVCFVGTDNYELGYTIGELVNDAIKSGERFGAVAHVESSFTAIERIRGLLDGVNNAGVTMAALEYCEGSSDISYEKTTQMLRDNPDITCMVGLNETSALGICRALEDLGLDGQIKVISCDSSEAQIKYMEKGTIEAFVIQNPFNMGYLSVEAAVMALEGKKVESVINTGSVLITKETMGTPENQKLLFPFTD